MPIGHLRSGSFTTFRPRSFGFRFNKWGGRRRTGGSLHECTAQWKPLINYHLSKACKWTQSLAFQIVVCPGRQRWKIFGIAKRKKKSVLKTRSLLLPISVMGNRVLKAWLARPNHGGKLFFQVMRSHNLKERFTSTSACLWKHFWGTLLREAFQQGNSLLVLFYLQC